MGGHVENVSVLVATVNAEAEVISVAEGMKEDRGGAVRLIERGLKGVHLRSAKCAGTVATVGLMGDTSGAWCTMRNIARRRRRHTANTSRPYSPWNPGNPPLAKAEQVATEMESKAAANCLREGVGDDDLPAGRVPGRALAGGSATNTMSRAAEQDTRVVGRLPDGNSALMLYAPASVTSPRTEVDPPLSRHVPAGDNHVAELTIAPWTATTKVRNFSGTTSF